MFYKDYYSLKKRATKKDLVIVILAMVVALLLGAALSLKAAYDLRVYAIANDCEWIWQGTHYGDDRDYICR